MQSDQELARLLNESELQNENQNLNENQSDSAVDRLRSEWLRIRAFRRRDGYFIYYQDSALFLQSPSALFQLNVIYQ